MILVVGTVRAPEGALKRLAPAAAKMVAETLKEPGCIRYAYAQDLLDPCVMHVSEAWADEEALKAHFATPHMAEWREAVGSAGMSDRNLRVYATDEGTPI